MNPDCGLLYWPPLYIPPIAGPIVAAWPMTEDPDTPGALIPAEELNGRALEWGEHTTMIMAGVLAASLRLTPATVVSVSDFDACPTFTHWVMVEDPDEPDYQAAWAIRARPEPPVSCN